MAILSLVVSAWKSRKIIFTFSCSRSRVTSFSTVVNGLSSGGFIKVLPCAFRTASLPWGVSTVIEPLPGVSDG